MATSIYTGEYDSHGDVEDEKSVILTRTSNTKLCEFTKKILCYFATGGTVEGPPVTFALPSVHDRRDNTGPRTLTNPHINPTSRGVGTLREGE